MRHRKTETERVLPGFLDRLTDHYPRATKEGAEYRTLSMKRYREGVLRDLEFLLNTTAPPQAPLSPFAHVGTSVLNYGLEPLGGVWASQMSAEAIVGRIRKAILDFETRILPASLRVRLLPNDAPGSATVMHIEITGELWAEPCPERIHIKTDIDLETGICRVSA